MARSVVVVGLLRRRVVAIALALVAAGATGCTSLLGDPTTTSTTTPTPEQATTTTAPGTLTEITAIQAGQCFEDVGDETAQSFVVSLVSCADPHTYEAYLVAPFAGPQPSGKGDAYPGELVLANAAEEQCNASFAAFMGIEWEASDFDIRTWWPFAKSWNQGNRTIVCAVYKVTGTVVGSARGTAV